jgi:hypothetical protein
MSRSYGIFLVQEIIPTLLIPLTGAPSLPPSLPPTELLTPSPSIIVSTVLSTAPSDTPSFDPSVVPSSLPTVGNILIANRSNLLLTITGLPELTDDDISLWQNITSAHVMTYWKDFNRVDILSVVTELTSQLAQPGDRRLQGTVELQTGFVYNQKIVYRPLTDNAPNGDDLFLPPFQIDKTSYASSLQQLNAHDPDIPIFIDSVSDLSIPTSFPSIQPSMPPTTTKVPTATYTPTDISSTAPSIEPTSMPTMSAPASSSGGLDTKLIIIIAVGAVGGLVLIYLLYLLFSMKRDSDPEVRGAASTTASVITGALPAPPPPEIRVKEDDESTTPEVYMTSIRENLPSSGFSVAEDESDVEDYSLAGGTYLLGTDGSATSDDQAPRGLSASAAAAAGFTSDGFASDSLLGNMDLDPYGISDGDSVLGGMSTEGPHLIGGDALHSGTSRGQYSNTISST